MENVNVVEELKIKNQQMLLNKKRIDLDNSMESLIVFYSNYSSSLANDINIKICSYKNVEPFSEQGRIMSNTISGFFTLLSNKFKELITKRVTKIKEKLDDISDIEYNKELRYLSIQVINKMLEFYGENVDMLIDELNQDTDDLTANRINSYLYETIYVKMMDMLKDKFMYSLKVIDNNFEENYQVIQSINEKTLKSV